MFTRSTGDASSYESFKGGAVGCVSVMDSVSVFCLLVVPYGGGMVLCM